MSTIREIPGYYYDQEKKRYFKVSNGSVSSQSQSKYHNNSIQKEKRKQSFQTSNNQISSINSRSNNKKQKKKQNDNRSTITNPQIYKLLPKQKKQLAYDPSCHLKFSLSSTGLLNLKTGAIDLSKLYNKDDQIDILKSQTSCPRYIPELVPRGIVLAQINKQLLFVHRIPIPPPIPGDLTKKRYPKLLTIQNIRNGKVYNIPQCWNFECGGSTLNDYLPSDASIMEDKVIHNIKFGAENSHINFIQLITVQTGLGCSTLLRFHGCDVDTLSTFHYTADFLRFVKLKSDKLRSKIKQRLNILFGLESVSLVEEGSPPVCSIDEANDTLEKLRNCNLLDCEKLVQNRKLKDFLHFRDVGIQEPMIYRDLICYKDDLRLVAGYFHNANELYLISSQGDIIKIVFTVKKGQLIFNKLFYAYKSMKSSSIKDIYKLNNYVFVGTGKSLLRFKDSDLEEYGSSQKSVGCLEVKIDYVRKFIPLSIDQHLVIKQNNISKIHYTGENTVIEQPHRSYLNDNNPHQTFEIFNNHLLYNIGENEFIIENLNRNDGDNLTKFKIEFNFQKCGYLKGFKLIKMIQMKSETNRLRIGFTFLNQDEDTTIFNTYEI
ncbi:uncharacterized protein J8A68_003695 [[Candida] subhashii]|uniref:Uncharacterized protein n=1 Tax=[Candida] subhashii TaxID=561895 RepID=A0A8J5QGS4_9ASCO|nr:uncharacterized protein J8A68_003695 [[Candida] subhashii]KAG7662772.1 hypothetical protein J8A68_003695 [[Candida] subhashii]